MATQDQKARFIELVDAFGGHADASRAIASVKKDGYAPSRSALGKIYRGDRSPENYVMQCYIDDLEKALGVQNEKD